MNFWAPGPSRSATPVLQVFASAAPMPAFALLGVDMGIVHKRRGQAGTWGLIIASMVVSGGLAILVTWLDAPSGLANWFTDQSTTTLTIGLPPAIALIAALVPYPGIRRVVP
jgi:hypothetical protein